MDTVQLSVPILQPSIPNPGVQVGAITRIEHVKEQSETYRKEREKFFIRKFTTFPDLPLVTAETPVESFKVALISTLLRRELQNHLTPF